MLVEAMVQLNDALGRHENLFRVGMSVNASKVEPEAEAEFSQMKAEEKVLVASFRRETRRRPHG